VCPELVGPSARNQTVFRLAGPILGTLIGTVFEQIARTKHAAPHGRDHAAREANSTPHRPRKHVVPGSWHNPLAEGDGHQRRCAPGKTVVRICSGSHSGPELTDSA
jgi:hypothetical protein